MSDNGWPYDEQIAEVDSELWQEMQEAAQQQEEDQDK